MQARRHSLLEAVISTAVGFGVAFATNLIVLPWFGFAVSYVQSFWLTVIFTFISVARGYGVRRLFNWLHATKRL